MSLTEPAHDKALRVLLIEDDLDTQANLRDILSLDGHSILLAGTALDGRRIAKKQAPDVIILDRQLPDANADQLLPDLRELTPQGDIVIVTGFADIESTIAALRFGASDYILKPVNPDALRASLERIVQRRHIERELRSEQQFAERVVKTAEAVVLVLDLDGKIIDFNPFFERLTNWSLQECVGHDWFERFIPSQDTQRIRRLFMQVASGATDLASSRTSNQVADHAAKTNGTVNSIVTRDGRQRAVRWTNTTLRDDEGNTTAVLSVGVDVTDFLSAQARALQAERLATIGQTMTGLAHESRNALQRIQASLELLSLELEDNPNCTEDLAKIGRATRDLNALLEEVRSYAAPIVIAAKPANLIDIWRRCWRDLEVSRSGRDVRLVECVNTPSLVAKVDELRMEQVFRNLFENSLAACSDPVIVTVRCDEKPDHGLTVSIADNGPGFDQDQQQRLFEPFFTTKSSGTGLGMAIAQRIVLAHDGDITASPPSHLGATVTIHLPSPQN
jgi:PAS domain S-box-containing protein